MNGNDEGQAFRENDLLVVSRFKNLRLVKALEDYGLSQVQLAANLDMPFAHVNQLVNLKASPLLTCGDYSPSARLIAEYFGVDVAEMFPPPLYTLKLPNRVLRAYSSAEVVPLLAASNMPALLGDPEASLDRKMQSNAVAAAIDSIPTNLQLVLIMRFGLFGEDEHTLEEVGAKLGKSRERIRCMEAKALRFLRQPARSRPLRPYVELEPLD